MQGFNKDGDRRKLDKFDTIRLSWHTPYSTPTGATTRNPLTWAAIRRNSSRLLVTTVAPICLAVNAIKRSLRGPNLSFSPAPSPWSVRNNRPACSNTCGTGATSRPGGKARWMLSTALRRRGVSRAKAEFQQHHGGKTLRLFLPLSTMAALRPPMRVKPWMVRKREAR
jgi:hypothetical protein